MKTSARRIPLADMLAMLKNWIYAFLFAAVYLILCGYLDDRDNQPTKGRPRHEQPRIP